MTVKEAADQLEDELHKAITELQAAVAIAESNPDDFRHVLECYWEIRPYKRVIQLNCNPRLSQALDLLESYFNEPCYCGSDWCRTKQAREFYNQKRKETHDIIN